MSSQHFIPAYTANKVWTIHERVEKLMSIRDMKLERNRELDRARKERAEINKAEKRRAYKREWERKMRALKAYQRNDTDWFLDDEGNWSRSVGG